MKHEFLSLPKDGGWIYKNEAEKNELKTWLRSLENRSLGVPVEISVDLIKNGCMKILIVD